MGEITIRQPHAVLRLRVHPRRESAAIPPTQLPDLVERADFCEKVRAARSAFVAHHRRAIKRVLCEVGAQHPCQAQAPVNVGGRPPGRPLANPRTRKSADRNGLTLCESQIPVEKGRNFDILQRQSPGVLGTLARISPWVKLSAEPSCRPPRQVGSLLRYPAAIPASYSFDCDALQT